MSTDMQTTGPGALAERQPQSGDVAAQLMAVIAANPTAGGENLKALLDGMERVNKWEAERAFTAAFARLKFPAIVKGSKNAGSRSTYAAYDDIQKIIDPILSAEGFTVSYSSGPATDQGVPTIGLLSHVAGHSRPTIIYLPVDRSGAMKDQPLWGMGSTTSYGMRYCAKMMLNLRFVGEDNDGQGACISANQVEILREAMMKANVNESKMLEVYGVKVLGDLPAANFAGIQGQINQKYRMAFAKTGMDEADIAYNIRLLWGGK